MDFQKATRRSKRLQKNGSDSGPPVMQSVEPVHAHASSFRPLSTYLPDHRISIHSLSLELVRSIVEQACLDRKDMCSLSLTSSLLRDEAQRMLFKDPGQLILGNTRFSGDKFLDSIIASPKRLAPMVRVYSQIVDWQRFRYTARKTAERPAPRKERHARQKLILGKIRRALQLMVNLKHLAHEERTREEPLVETITSVLTDKCSFQLTSLVWTYVAVDGIREELELFYNFLPRQSALRRLCFNRNQVSKKLARPRDKFYAVAGSVCPQLEELSAPLDFIISVLPMRPAIKRLSWPARYHDLDTEEEEEEDISATNLACLANSLETVESLDYGHSVSELVLLSSHLKSLVLLSVDCLSCLSLTILSKLPRLRVVTVTMESRLYSSINSDDLEQVKSALLHSPSLTYIDISNIRGDRGPYRPSYSEYWCLRYSLDSENILTSRVLPIEEHFDWDTRRSFRIP